jgi:hypothetical protein
LKFSRRRKLIVSLLIFDSSEPNQAPFIKQPDKESLLTLTRVRRGILAERNDEHNQPDDCLHSKDPTCALEEEKTVDLV